MRSGWLRISILGLLVANACADLREIPAGECGNGVIEPPEDCDSFAPDRSSICRPKGVVGECRLDCRIQNDGTRASCPDGWGCDRDGICRVPSGTFEAPSQTVAAGAWSLQAGDFDGDGRADVVSREQLDAVGETKLRFNYFDENGNLSESQIFPKLLLSPAITRLPGDARSDLIFSDTRIGVLHGRANRNLVPETFSSFRVPTHIRVVAVYHGAIEQVSAFLSLATKDGVPGYYIPDSKNRGILRLLGQLPGPVESLVGEPVSGDIIEDATASPCRELVLAVRGATQFTLVDSCTRDPLSADIVWRNQLQQTQVALDPPAAIDAAPLIADLNGDDHLDVLLGAAGKTYAAYGDGQRLAPAKPFQLQLANPSAIMSPDIPMPLAAGDFTGDGFVDFVFDDHVLVSSTTPNSALPSYAPDHGNMAARWTSAQIADLNNNGLPDVVAASNAGLDIDFFNGTGTQYLTAFSIPTNGPVQRLAVGDFDGDLINDLAFVETAASDREPDALRIAFGNVAGMPEVPSQIAQVTGVEQLSTFNEHSIDNLAVASFETLPTGPSGALAFLAGSGDRLPFAPFQLTSFASDGSVQGSAAVALAAGSFTAANQGDVIALASLDPIGNPLQLWLLPSVDQPGTLPVRLNLELDSRLVPVRGAGFDLQISAVSAVGDVDGDGRDEAVFAVPADGAQACGVVIVGTSDPRSSNVEARSTVYLDEPCTGAQLMSVDADRDGSVDIALLTGAPGEDHRRLLVLWNKGQGNFASDTVSAVNGPDDSPQGFAYLPANSASAAAFFYVTDQAIVRAGNETGDRQFETPRVLFPIERGSGIVAADVNGDGVTDLAIATSGNLTVMKAQLVVR